AGLNVSGLKKGLNVSGLKKNARDISLLRYMPA
ncbi:hypothetical protein, partial [Escherichia coli]